MTPREFRQEQEYEFGHFQELTITGIDTNYVNIEKFAEDYHQAKLKLLGISDFSNCKTEPKLGNLETELGKLQEVHGKIVKHFEVHSGCDSFKFKDGAVYRVKIERNQTKATLD